MNQPASHSIFERWGRTAYRRRLILLIASLVAVLGAGLRRRHADSAACRAVQRCRVPDDAPPCSSPEAQDAVLAEIFRLLRPGGVLAGQDSLDSPELRSLHHDDIYVPVDPAGPQGRLEAAGFTAVQADTNEYAVRFRGTKAGAATGSRAATGARNGPT
jgi:hypothetical protein